MSNTINSAINKVIHVKPAINRKRILRYAEKFPGVDTIVNEFFMRGPIKSQFPDQHPIDEAVTHAIAVYQSFVDEGLVRLAGKLSERDIIALLNVACDPMEMRFISASALVGAIADSVGAENFEDIPQVLQDLAKKLWELDSIEMAAVVDVTRQFWVRVA